MNSIPQRPVSIPYKKDPNSVESKIYDLLPQITGLDSMSIHVQQIDQKSIKSIQQIIQQNTIDKQKLQTDMGLYQTLIDNFNASYQTKTEFSIRFKVLGLKNYLWQKHYNMEKIKKKMPVYYEAIQKFLRDMNSKNWNINVTISDGSTFDTDTDGSICTFNQDFVKMTFSW